MVAESIRKLSRHIHKRFSRNKGRLIIRTANNSQSALKERAANENALTTPPGDERIRLYAFCGVELYTPMHFDKLANALQEIGWSTNDDNEERYDPVKWLREGRHPVGVTSTGSIETGIIERRSFPIDESRSQLPKNMTNGRLRILSITPSMVAVAAWFETTEEGSRCYEEILRMDRALIFQKQSRSRRPYGPLSQKYDHIDRARSETGKSILSWFREYMPGIFASGLIDDQLPSCEFVTIQNAEPFGERDNELSANDGFLEVLGLRTNHDTWVNSSSHGLKFALPGYRLFAPKYHCLAAVNWSTLNADDDEDYPRGFLRRIRHIDETIAHALSAWSVVALFEGYTRRLVQVRQSVMQGNSTPKNAADVLKGLEYEIAYSSDIATVAAELSLDDRKALSSLRRCNSLRPQSKTDENKEWTLLRYLRGLAQRRWEEALRNDHAIRDHMTQYGALLSARENIRLQRGVSRLSCFVLVVAVISLISVISVIAALEVLNFWDWVRSCDVLDGYTWLGWFMDMGADK